MSAIGPDGGRRALPERRRPTAQEIRRARDLAMRKLVRSGMTQADAGAFFGVARETVNRRLRKIPEGLD